MSRAEAEPIIRLSGVTKRFGRTVAVDDVTVDVPRGRCLGWLGPNGSGKTTLIRCMLGLARASAGTIHVRGREVPKDVRHALSGAGAIVEEPRFYPYLSGRRNLEVAAGFVGRDAFGRLVADRLEQIAQEADCEHPGNFVPFTATGGITITYANGGVGNLPAEATVAYDGTWEFSSITGVTTSTGQDGCRPPAARRSAIRRGMVPAKPLTANW